MSTQSQNPFFPNKKVVRRGMRNIFVSLLYPCLTPLQWLWWIGLMKPFKMVKRMPGIPLQSLTLRNSWRQWDQKKSLWMVLEKSSKIQAENNKCRRSQKLQSILIIWDRSIKNNSQNLDKWRISNFVLQTLVVMRLKGMSTLAWWQESICSCKITWPNSLPKTRLI